MKKFFSFKKIFLFLLIILGGVFTFGFLYPYNLDISNKNLSSEEFKVNNKNNLDKNNDSISTSSNSQSILFNQSSSLIIGEKLKNPPLIVKGIYATSWSAGNSKKINELISIIKKNNLNSIVIDIKDYSGYLAYDIPIEEAKIAGALSQTKIKSINELIQKLHSENIYVIARVTVFQDPVFAKAYPQHAIKNKSTGQIWKDNKGLSWIDPASKNYWNYIIKISRDASNRGFDEINFDYIRFPSDGDLKNITYPFWDEKTPQKEIIKEFFSYLRKELNDIKISADVFGLTTIASGSDLGIGQIIEDAYLNFDAVCPMIYPSHFASGSFGYKNPADYPYEVIRSSLEEALRKIQNTTSSKSLIRPWLQVFDLGARYDNKKIQDQIKATEEVLANTNYYGGYLLWDPKNIYLDL